MAKMNNAKFQKNGGRPGEGGKGEGETEAKGCNK